MNFHGEFYRHTLMTPNFSPRGNPYPAPPIYVGALGPRMTRATAEVADGLLFLHEATMPAVRDELKAAGRDIGDFAVVPEIIVSIGEAGTRWGS